MPIALFPFKWGAGPAGVHIPHPFGDTPDWHAGVVTMVATMNTSTGQFVHFIWSSITFQ